MLDAGDDMKLPASRPAQFQNCGQNKFVGGTHFRVLTSNEATDTWYGGKKHYNFAAGKANSESQKASAL
jgi:hypothetical protein